MDERLRQIAELQARNTPQTPQRISFAIPDGPKPDEINGWAKRIYDAVADGRLDNRIAEKAARAICYQLISQHDLWSIVDNLNYAKCRGAYFVAGLKRAFARRNLSWLEEEWPT